MKFICIEYKKNGNDIKQVRRELLPLDGCNTLHYCRYTEDYGTFTRDFYAIYKTANGYAVKWLSGVNELHHINPNAVQEFDKYNTIELVQRGALFGGRAVIEFVRLSGTVDEWRTVVEWREVFDKEQERKEQERERERVAREEEERKAEEQRREALMIEAINIFVEGSKVKCVSVEAVELVANAYEVKTHARTIGALRENVAKVRGDGAILPRRTKSAKGSKISFEGVLSFVREVREAVISVDNFLSGKTA